MPIWSFFATFKLFGLLGFIYVHHQHWYDVVDWQIDCGLIKRIFDSNTMIQYISSLCWNFVISKKNTSLFEQIRSGNFIIVHITCLQFTIPSSTHWTCTWWSSTSFALFQGGIFGGGHPVERGGCINVLCDVWIRDHQQLISIHEPSCKT